MGTLTRTWPRRVLPRLSISACADATSSRMRTPCWYSAWPGSVSSRRRVVRRSNCAPAWCSSSRSWRLTCERVTPRRRPASARLPASTMSTKAWIRLRSIGDCLQHCHVWRNIVIPPGLIVDAGLHRYSDRLTKPRQGDSGWPRTFGIKTCTAAARTCWRAAPAWAAACARSACRRAT
ncbi:hypothetical protein CBM2634_A250051 [Cupriavidus taiwanensis]|uniref:Uncharacterized protein n=1 Tax=Cupriavidus taiwanensis TaxID=164546 RepID=A0A375J3Z8_9BURK|nr:hypothetical protein CBM2634_A250051 [Cupriavidus taiwanensis]